MIFKRYISKPIEILATEVTDENIEYILNDLEIFIHVIINFSCCKIIIHNIFAKAKFLRTELNDKYIDKYDKKKFIETFIEQGVIKLTVNKALVFCILKGSMFIKNEVDNVFSFLNKEDFKEQFDFLN